MLQSCTAEQFPDQPTEQINRCTIKIMPSVANRDSIFFYLKGVDSHQQAPEDPDHCVKEDNREDFHEGEAKQEDQDWGQCLDHYHTRREDTRKEDEKDFQSDTLEWIYIKTYRSTLQDKILPESRWGFCMSIEIRVAMRRRRPAPIIRIFPIAAKFSFYSKPHSW